VVENELILFGIDYDKEGKPIAYLGRAKGRRGHDIRFAGTAFLTLTGEAKEKLQNRIARFPQLRHRPWYPRSASPSGSSLRSWCAFGTSRAVTLFDTQLFRGPKLTNFGMW